MALAAFLSPIPRLFLLPRPPHSPAYKPFPISRSSTVGLPRCSPSGADDAPSTNGLWKLMDAGTLRRLSRMVDAGEVLAAVAEIVQSCGVSGELEPSDCNAIISAAFDQGNVELALSVFDAMRSGLYARWPRPDARTYSLLITRLAAMMRVADAIRIVGCVAGMGVPSAEEVPFGMIVRCPACMIALSVAQPQHGIQVASCSKCRYQYELVSGNIIKIESEEISVDLTTWERALRYMSIMKDELPAAVHSIVVRTPTGTALTHKFATKTVEMPAQEGERVTISSAAPSTVYRDFGPFKMGPRRPGLRPSEPMCLTNHRNGLVSQLLRAPTKSGIPFLLNPYILFPSIAVLAGGDALSAFIDPSLPKFLSVALLTSATIGTAFDQVVLPELRKLPPIAVDVVARKQQLLSQYDMLQARIKVLREGAEKEVWMLARMSQLENKILAVGEPSYRARRDRIKRVIESLESALQSRIQLIESYAKISSMIEIEVEMDSDVPVAESASSAERISEQIEQLLEIDSLEEQWRIQAEANDEAERLLSSDMLSSEWA